MMQAKIRCCVVVPVYNHSERLASVVNALLAKKLPVILVDDGSDTACADLIQQLALRPQVFRCQHEQNQGKGAAVKTGLRFALAQGFSHGLQVDADGQHNLDDVNDFMRAAEQAPTSLIIAYPEYDSSVPRHRYYARYLTHVWIWINTLSTTIIDSMCGFRVYPLRESVNLINSVKIGDRMDYDSEFIVRWYWSKAPLVQKPTRVIYHDQGTSHFKLFTDNKLISFMHTRLFFGMLLRIPLLLSLRGSANE